MAKGKPEGKVTQKAMVQAALDDDESSLSDPSWQLAIRLRPLTRSETEHYISAKLSAVGRSDTVFTDRSIGRIYDLSGGNPRGVDRLATLALMAGAVRGLELIPSEVIDGVAQECEAPSTGIFAA